MRRTKPPVPVVEKWCVVRERESAQLFATRVPWKWAKGFGKDHYQQFSTYEAARDAKASVFFALVAIVDAANAQEAISKCQ